MNISFAEKEGSASGSLPWVNFCCPAMVQVHGEVSCIIRAPEKIHLEELFVNTSGDSGRKACTPSLPKFLFVLLCVLPKSIVRYFAVYVMNCFSLLKSV